MKYVLLADFGRIPAGTIIDERDRIEFTILTDKKFYDTNPNTFKPVPEVEFAMDRAYHGQACLWDGMPETSPGSGVKIGWLSCPCPKCSPRC